MSDGTLLLVWMVLLLAGTAFCVLARRSGVPATYVRDLLHIGAGVWPLGWTLWTAPQAPVGLAVAGAATTLLVPLLSRKTAALALFRESISDKDERWDGVALYGLSFAVFTTLGLRLAPFPAAAALLALALGDGIGGAVGRRFGRLRYRPPGAKTKSLEGSVTVALLSMAGVLIASLRFGVPLTPGRLAAAGLLAALVEAWSPRSTDNLTVPAAVWLFLRGVT